jgi:hypothetical protein
MQIFGFHMAKFQWLILPFTSTLGLLDFQHLLIIDSGNTIVAHQVHFQIICLWLFDL